MTRPVWVVTLAYDAGDNFEAGPVIGVTTEGLDAAKELAAQDAITRMKWRGDKPFTWHDLEGDRIAGTTPLVGAWGDEYRITEVQGDIVDDDCGNTDCSHPGCPSHDAEEGQ